jgi:hypothetical protein
MVTSSAYAQDYPLFDPDITTQSSAMLDPNNFELGTELANTVKEAMPGIFVANQCYTEMQSKNFTHQELCTAILKQFNEMLTEFNSITRENVTQLMNESR